LDIKWEIGGSSLVEVEFRNEKFGDILKLQKSKQANLVQRSRLKWFKDRDTNSQLLHNCVKCIMRKKSDKGD